MADYVEILDTQIEPDAPLTAVLAGQWRDNPIAIAEGADDAPSLQGAGWLPYNMTTNDAAATGVFFSAAADGSFTTLDFPDFDPEYDYIIIGQNFRMGGGSGSRNYNIALVFDGPVVEGDSASGLLPGSNTISIASRANFLIEVENPRLLKRFFNFKVIRHVAGESSVHGGWTSGDEVLASDAAQTTTRTRFFRGDVDARRLKNLRMVASGSLNLDLANGSGEIRMLRRRFWGAK